MVVFGWSGQCIFLLHCMVLRTSLLASDSLRKLRSSIHKVVWSRRQPLANVGAVLSLLDGPAGCDPLFCVVWFRFRLFRRYLALWPCQAGRAYRLLEMVSEGCPGHGPIHLLVSSAAVIGFRWDPLSLAWSRHGLPLLSNLAGPIQHFRAAILDAWRNKAAVDLCGREGFRGGPLLDVHGSLQVLSSSHFRERDKALLRSVMVGVSGMVSCWAGLGVSLFHVDSVVLQMVMVIYFGNVPSLLLRFVTVLSFTISREWTRLIGHAAYSGMAGSLLDVLMLLRLLLG